MDRQKLVQLIQERKNVLCVGLDPSMDLLPKGIDPTAAGVAVFLKSIIDATREHCVAYKPNLAFFEALGYQGWQLFEDIVRYIGGQHFVIADAKRSDIGHTAEHYRKAFFDVLPCDALTLSPYMGSDAIKPFLREEGKWAVVLAVTSNAGASDFQFTVDAQGLMLFERVIKEAKKWGTPDNLMFVVGATRLDILQRARSQAPSHFFLVPGVGAQGGDLASVCEAGLTADGGLLINASRSILYADGGSNYAEAAAAEAKSMGEVMRAIIDRKNVF